MPIFSLWLFGAAGVASISYSRQITPLLAMHCNGCHGDAGGLSLRSYRELMLGGNLGRVIVPGDPDRSLIIHFLDGRRGENHRMPKDGRPLSPEQIGIIRRWIEQGAKEDHAPAKVWRRTLPSVPMTAIAPTRVRCKVNVPAYLVVTVRRPGLKGEILWEDAVSVKRPKEKGDVGEPEQEIRWDLRPGYGWPRSVRMELEIRHAASEPTRIEFSAQKLATAPWK